MNLRVDLHISNLLSHVPENKKVNSHWCLKNKLHMSIYPPVAFLMLIYLLKSCVHLSYRNIAHS
jgi:hypothetical protein